MGGKIISRLYGGILFYIVSAAVIICLWLWVFDNAAQPSANEKLLVTLIGAGFDDKTLSADLEKELREMTDGKINKITVEKLNFQSDYEMTNALWARSLDSDIIIVAEGYMLDGIGDSYFHPIDEERYRETFGEVRFYRENGIAYGIVLSVGERDNVFSRYCADENARCFFTYNSVNAGSLNENGGESVTALETVKWLLS